MEVFNIIDSTVVIAIVIVIVIVQFGGGGSLSLPAVSEYILSVSTWKNE